MTERNMNEDDAFAAIGYALLEEEFGSKRMSFEEAVDIGRRWFQSAVPKIQEYVCGNKLVNDALLTEAAQARNAALSSVLDTVLAPHFKNLPVATVSNAVICYGIHKLCVSYVR